MSLSIYQSLYDLIHTYIYGGVTLTPDMSLICTLIATIGCLAFVAIPFFVVYKILSFIIGGFYR